VFSNAYLHIVLPRAMQLLSYCNECYIGDKLLAAPRGNLFFAPIY